MSDQSRLMSRDRLPDVRLLRASVSLVLATVVGWTLMCLTLSDAMAAPTKPMRFSHVTLDDGLSQSNVQAIFQDSRGYLWFATESGLNRYDGYEITRYVRERGRLDALSNDFIWTIAEDANQDLWLATLGGGVVRWNRVSDTFTTFRHDPADPGSLASDEIRTLLVNADGTLWVGTRDKGLDLFDPRTGQATHFRHDPEDVNSLSNDMVYALEIDSVGDLWVGTDGGANRMRAASGAFERFTPDAENAASLSDDLVRVIYEDSQRTLWIGTAAGGLNRLDRRTDEFRRYRNDSASDTTLSNDHVRVVFEDDAGRLWVGTEDGLNLLDRDSGEFDRYKHDPANPDGLNDSYINSIYQDRAGLLWIGTRSAGASLWNPRSWSLGQYSQPWLSDADITSFASNGEGQVWVGTVGAGLVMIDEQSHAVARYLHDPELANTISDNNVMSLLLDRDGILWIGTETGGLNRLDPASGQLRIYRHDPDDAGSIAADGVMTIFEDREGQLWLGTYGGGVSILDRQTNRFRHLRHAADDPRSLSDPRASAIVQDVSGAIWVGTFGGGLNLLDAETGDFRRFAHDPDDPASLADNMVYALHVDAAGRIWVGTAGGGLDLVVPADDRVPNLRFSNVSQRHGLPNNVINGIQSDASGRLWLSTNYGLSRFDPETLSVKTFHRGHGLQGEEFNYAAHHRGPDGKLYFGGADGFNAFYPDAVEGNTYSPDIVLTSYQKLNERVITDVPYDRLTQIDLDYRDDVVRFEFAALDFTAPLQTTYSYMLEGFDTGWLDLGSRRDVTYTNLDAGDYVLRVNARTSEGVTAASAFSIPVSVAPAPWQSPLAYLLYGIVALLLGWSLWRMQKGRFEREARYSRRLEQDVAERTAQLRERNVELQVASRAKSDFLARMSHEIRTPMNGILGMTQLLLGTSLDDKQFRFSQTIKRSAESLLDIISDILDFSKIEAGRLELDEVEFDVSDLVDETVELFSGAASEKGLELMCSTPPGKTVHAAGDPLRLKQILVNLLGNAVKFTQDGEVVVKYMVVADEGDDVRLRFDIADTGVGVQQDNLSMIFRKFSQEDNSTSRRFGGTGLGLAICKQLVEMMDGKIGVASEPGKGSRFWFTVKLKKADGAWSSRGSSQRLANLNVLVVDDNATHADIVTSYLSALGIRTEVAASGNAAIKRLESDSSKANFDVIMVDAKVGVLNGVEVARAIRAIAMVEAPKIVVMSTAGEDLDEHQLRAAGIDDSLPKPIRQSMLYECLLMLTAGTGAFAPRKAPRETDGHVLPRLNGRVLLVEDNPVNQAVAVEMLQQLGLETVVAINGREAVDRASIEAFDIILMDCEMPVMDGFEATAVIRDTVAEEERAPIVALTANAVDGDRERCIAAGMQDYLSKPLTMERLHEMLEKWLGTATHELTRPFPDPIDPASLDSIRKLQGVGGNKLVRRVVDLYLSSSSALVENLRTGLEQGDPEVVRQGAHALKSSSQNVGAAALVTLGQELEEMGRSGQIVDSERYMVELNALYPQTVTALKAVIEQPDD